VLHLRPIARLAALAALLCSPFPVPASAAQQACGTVIVPALVGMGPPNAVNSFSWLFSTSEAVKQLIPLFQRPLVWLNRDGRVDRARSLASDVSTPDGGRTYDITLHPWLWSEGQPVTADDVVFTFGLIDKLGPAYAGYDSGGIPTMLDSVAATGPHSLRITLKRKVNPDWFIQAGLSNGIAPMPKHIFGGLDLETLRRRKSDPTLFAVSDGPFVLSRFALGRFAVLDANPLYGGKHPQIRRLVVTFPQGDAALEQLRDGEVDMADVPILLSGRLKGFGDFDVVRPDPLFDFGSGIVNFQSKNAPFLADKTVRVAIARGVNQQELIDLVFRGNGVVTHGVVPPSMTAYLSPDALAGYPDLSYDPRAAAALLDKDGWKPGPDGIRTKNGQRLAFTLMTSSENTNRIIEAQVMQRNLRAIGIDVSLHVIAFNQMVATLEGNGQDWDMVMLTWTTPTYPDFHDFFRTGASQNYGHYTSAEADRLDDAIIYGNGAGALHDAQDLSARDALQLFLPSPTPSVLVRRGIGGVNAFLSPNGMWSPEELTLSGPLACPASSPDPARKTADARTP